MASDRRSEEAFAFPYRVVLHRGDGSEEVLDPAYLPLPVDPEGPWEGERLITEDESYWEIEEVLDRNDVVFTWEELPPEYRLATLVVRESPLEADKVARPVEPAPSSTRP